jgi:hypothetical protein
LHVILIVYYTITEEDSVTHSGVNATQIVPADENAIAFARNTSEVLAIVYLGDAKIPGGFFPQGLNGAIA